MLRRLYDWCVAAAGRPYAVWLMGGISFLESSIFPIPPDTMLIPMSLARPDRAWIYAHVCTLTSVAGGILNSGTITVSTPVGAASAATGQAIGIQLGSSFNTVSGFVSGGIVNKGTITASGAAVADGTRACGHAASINSARRQRRPRAQVSATTSTARPRSSPASIGGLRTASSRVSLRLTSRAPRSSMTARARM